MQREQDARSKANEAPGSTTTPAPDSELRPEIDAQLRCVRPGDGPALAHLMSTYPQYTKAILATAAARLGNSTVHQALAIARTPPAPATGSVGASTTSAPATLAPPSHLGEIESAVDHLVHGSQAAQVAKLSPSQRADYDAILAQNEGAAKTVDPEDALKKAQKGRPLSNEDRAAVEAARAKMAAVHVTSIDNHDPNQVQLEVSFDGTWNDRDEMAFETNPALINEMFDGPEENRIYEVGIGTSADTKVLGGATGLGFHERVKSAYTTLVARINQIMSTNPKAKIVLVVSGFSRGAAAARSFTNELDRLGVPVLSSQQADGSYAKHYETPQIGVMVLFDTVASVGLAGDSRNHNLDGSNIDLSIPKNAENVLHLTARDEKRSAFPLSSAIDPSHDDPRIHELSLPGAHSDIGGGYPNAYSGVSLELALDFMKKAGVHEKSNANAPVDINDPSLRLHESRSTIEEDAQDLVGKHQRKVFPSQNPQR